MATVFRRCGCRRRDGKAYPSLPERATTQQRALTCPRLLSDQKHGSWGFFINGALDEKTGRYRKVRKMGFALKREALQAAALAAAQQARDDEHPTEDNWTVEGWLAEWLERREREGLRQATLATYRRYVRKDITPALGRIRLRELRRHHVDAFLQRLLKDGRGVVTVHRVHAVVSSALTAAYRLDLVQLNAATGIQLPRERTQKLRVWEPEQVREFLLVASRHRLGPLYELVARSGLRRGELAYEDGRPLHPYYISDVFRRLVAEAGLPHLTFHGLRHEQASLLLSAGVPITAVSKRLGHASAAITSDLYSHLLDDADRRMADAVETVVGSSPEKAAHMVHTQPSETTKGPDPSK